MKKISLYFSLLLCVALTGCSKDDEGYKVEQREVSLKSGENHSITVTPTPKSFTSDNEYVATVSEKGMITAKRIGEAFIKIDDTPMVKVTVSPKYNLYEEPFMDWKATKADVISKFGKPQSDTSAGIAYATTSTVAPINVYLFDSSGKLEGSVVMVKTAYSSQLGSFLGERYAIASLDEGSYTFGFVNGLNASTITMMVGAKIYDLNNWMVFYAPYTVKTRSQETDAMTAIKEVMQGLE